MLQVELLLLGCALPFYLWGANTIAASVVLSVAVRKCGVRPIWLITFPHTVMDRSLSVLPFDTYVRKVNTVGR